MAADDPAKIAESVRAVEQHGYRAGVADVACLSGAAPAFGLASGSIVSYLLFADENSAHGFIEAHAKAEDGAQMGVAEVTTYCLD